MRRLLSLAALLAVTLAAEAALAQPADSVRWRNDCRLAIQVIRTGQPAPHAEWAFRQIRACGAEGARAVADRMLAMRASLDTSAWNAVTFPAARDLHDAAIFEASVAIAADPTASDVARAFAFRNLIWIIHPSADLEHFDPWTAETLGCMGSRLDGSPAIGDPLPPDTRDRIRAAALSVVRNAKSPRPVWNSAYCVLVYGRWHREL